MPDEVMDLPSLQPDGSLRIRSRNNTPGFQADGVEEIDEDHPEYEYWMSVYLDRQQYPLDPLFAAVQEDVLGMPSEAKFEGMLDGSWPPEIDPQEARYQEQQEAARTERQTALDASTDNARLSTAIKNQRKSESETRAKQAEEADRRGRESRPPGGWSSGPASSG